jgi:hypothetical protein
MARVLVKGYTKKDGTKVPSHYREVSDTPTSYRDFGALVKQRGGIANLSPKAQEKYQAAIRKGKHTTSGAGSPRTMAAKWSIYKKAMNI